MNKISYITNFEEWENSFSYSCPIKVRFSETDAFGHLNNTKVFIYFEEARIEFLKEIGLMEQWLSLDSEVIPVTADLQCNYIRQVFFDERLDVFVMVHTAGNTSLDLHYMIKNKQGKICVTGRGRIVQVNKITGKATPFNEAFKKKIETFNTTNKY